MPPDPHHIDQRKQLVELAVAQSDLRNRSVEWPEGFTTYCCALGIRPDGRSVITSDLLDDGRRRRYP